MKKMVMKIMKLIFAVVHKDDVPMVETALGQKGIGATKIATTGGFLRTGNTTFMIGVDDDNYEKVLNLIRKNTKARNIVVNSASNQGGFPNFGMIGEDEISVGGATVFVVNVEHFEKI